VKPTNGRIKQIDTADFYFSEIGVHISDLDWDTDYPNWCFMCFRSVFPDKYEILSQSRPLKI